MSVKWDSAKSLSSFAYHNWFCFSSSGKTMLIMLIRVMKTEHWSSHRSDWEKEIEEKIDMFLKIVWVKASCLISAQCRCCAGAAVTTADTLWSCRWSSAVLTLICSRRGWRQSCSVHLPLSQGQGKYGPMSQEWQMVQKQQGKSLSVENALRSLFLTWMGWGRWIPC